MRYLINLLKKAFLAYWNLGGGYVSLVKASYDAEKELMTLEYSDGTEDLFKGTSTIWYKLPFLERCDTDMEFKLTEYLEYIKHWKGDYPDAHLKKLNSNL